jgi:hypothetical protein
VRFALAARLGAGQENPARQGLADDPALVEAHYFQNRARPNPAQIRFWLQELRTPEILFELVRRYAPISRHLVLVRPLLAYAVTGETKKLEQGLLAEESAEREQDRQYWLPLKAELEKLRHAK